VDPKNLVIAGDSAGGGLCLALLQILRDTEGLTLPAGAILISPVSSPAEEGVDKLIGSGLT
jgi:acetyl esterase/lipase